MTEAVVPRVFISYSHDTPEHKEWVMALAARLIEAGIDVTLDLWGLQPGDDLPHFMESNLVAADKVLMVCTEKYVDKANSGKGGVGYEKMIVTAALMKNIASSKVIPLIRQMGTTNVPTFLSSKLYLNFSDEMYEFSFDELVRTLHASPLYVKPPLGSRPDFNKPAPTTPTPPTTKGDPILLIMTHCVAQLENNPASSLIHYTPLLQAMKRLGISRLNTDYLLDQIVKKLGLLSTTNSKDYLRLTEAGRHYAMQNKLG